MNIREEIRKSVIESLKNNGFNGDFSVKVLRPKEASFGDYSISVAMEIGKAEKNNPMEIAEKIKEGIKGKHFEKIEVVRPGFINFFVSPDIVLKEINEVLKKGKKFGTLPSKKQKIQVEFISANPTGPLTVGNGRGGPFGDVLANTLKTAGYKVKKAYYVNDFGKQILSLGHSVLKDEAAKYTGEYIDKLNKKIKGKDAYKIGKEASKIILNSMIKKTVKNLNIKFDEWFSESTLYNKKEVDLVINLLRKKGFLYEQEGATWFNSMSFGDERDRVVIKSDNEKTYLAGDIAYHKYKFEKQKFDKVINVWGADHFGDVPGLMAGVEAIGHKGKLEVILLQFVTVMKDGKTVRMSKRLGTAITMDDLLDELSPDVIRFFFLMKSANTHLSFDLDLAKEQSEKNPVFSVQYAHARMSSILKNSKKIRKISKIKNVELLTHEKEIELMKQILKLPEVIEDTALDYEVHRIPQYAIDLATTFHKFYNDCHVLTEDKKLREARLGLVAAAKIALRNTLDIMGVSAPEKM
ncbi:MAG: arginine--tRNA ligase [Candidatus Pacebacteria bacterium]|nr:arginine--tRNA ligase [Candidatus Paceibacterota bacterium]